jgi:hypothetical protein
MTRRRHLPNRPTLARIAALRPLVAAGDAMTPEALAEALAAQGVPPPSRRLPWGRQAVLRLLKIMVGWHAGLPPDAGAADKLRRALRLLSEDATRVQLGIPGSLSPAQRRALVIILAAKSPGRRKAPERMLDDMAPEVGQAALAEARRLRQPVPLDRVFAGPAPRWTLAELLEATASQQNGVA